MKLKKINLFSVCCCYMLICGAAVSETVFYDFNGFSDGLINGQCGWKTLRKTPGSSAVSIFNELGETEETGDKALVIQLSDEVSKVVAADGLRWMPGQTFSMSFDFRIGITSQELAGNKPVLTVFIGNAYLSKKARWEIQLESTPDGTWTLRGGLPTWQEVGGIVGETVLERPEEGSAISGWMHFTVITKKLETPDSFESVVEIRNSADEVVAQMEFNDTLSDKQTTSMWDLSRVYCGFCAPRRQLGLVCIDNMQISSVD
ncbi:MAG: hypothetical protein ABFR47_03880 [Verrucomicrobiota bacterium]